MVRDEDELDGIHASTTGRADYLGFVGCGSWNMGVLGKEKGSKPIQHLFGLFFTYFS